MIICFDGKNYVSYAAHVTYLLIYTGGGIKLDRDDTEAPAGILAPRTALNGIRLSEHPSP